MHGQNACMAKFGQQFLASIFGQPFFWVAILASSFKPSLFGQLILASIFGQLFVCSNFWVATFGQQISGQQYWAATFSQQFLAIFFGPAIFLANIFGQHVFLMAYYAKHDALALMWGWLAIRTVERLFTQRLTSAILIMIDLRCMHYRCWITIARPT